MGSLQIQFAQPADSDKIAHLFCGSFPPEVAQLLIYGCKGAAEHIRRHLASGIPNAESAYFVAQIPGCIIGAVELRRQPNGLFLNYIAVDPAHRGRGVATALLSAAVRMAGVSFGQIALDVLHDNASALQWYIRLGFQTRTSAEFLELAPPGGENQAPAYVSGLPQADLCHDRFGFSSFNLISEIGTFPVGRIGDSWFRLTDSAAASNPAIFAALSLLDPRRRIFAIVPTASVPAAQAVRTLAKTRRMELEIPHLMSALTRDNQER